MYVLDEPSADSDIGTVVALPTDAVMLVGGSGALAFVDGDEVVSKRLQIGTSRDEYAIARKGILCVDRRTLEPFKAGDMRTFPQLLDEMDVVAGQGSPLLGPGTAS